MGTENKPLLSIKNLKTIFDLDEGSVKAVDGVSFDIFPQRVLGIVGESGCGKSVTIKSILRLIETPGRIIEGEILSNSNVRVIRDGSIVYTGKISTIFREKNQVKQVNNGQECGIALKDYMDFQKNDTIEAFDVTLNASIVSFF